MQVAKDKCFKDCNDSIKYFKETSKYSTVALTEQLQNIEIHIQFYSSLNNGTAKKTLSAFSRLAGRVLITLTCPSQDDVASQYMYLPCGISQNN